MVWSANASLRSYAQILRLQSPVSLGIKDFSDFINDKCFKLNNSRPKYGDVNIGMAELEDTKALNPKCVESD